MKSPVNYKNKEAQLEGHSLNDLANKFGTPLFAYSESFIRHKCQELKTAFSKHPTLACYALKANSNLSLLKIIFKEGLGADVVSQGELRKALLSKAVPENIVFSGVGKRDEEIREGIQSGIFSIQVESLEELDLIRQISSEQKQEVKISLRINPNINVKTNPYIATGLYKTKFGIPESQIPEALSLLKQASKVRIVGLSCHLGSQIKDTAPYLKASTRLVEIADGLRENGFLIEVLDLGGGFGVSYQGEKVPKLSDYAAAIQKPLHKTPYRLIVEPGRWIIAESGILLSRVIYTKSNPHKNFLVLDASMTELIRPALYEAHHEILSSKKTNPRKKVYDIVGPVCETSDFLGLERKLPEMKSGEIVWISHAGAYGSSMASHYNVRPQAAEVLLSEGKTVLIRQKEPLEDIWKNESVFFKNSHRS